jgi:hypothetical protein
MGTVFIYMTAEGVERESGNVIGGNRGNGAYILWFLGIYDEYESDRHWIQQCGVQQRCRGRSMLQLG